jgi:hypothetical protein
LAAGVPPDSRLWIRAAEDFVAMRFTTFVYHVLDQVRWLVTFALLGALTLVGAVFAYPLQPHRFITIFCGGLLLLAAGTALRIIVQMQGNEILRRLAPAAKGGTQTLNLARQVLTYVLLPVILLVARIFPELGDSLSSTLEPLLTVLQ